MLGKLATLVKSKTALAVLGVVLVGGSGGAVAMAATTGHLSTLGVNLNTSDGNKSPEASETPDSHDHTSVVGLLTGCNTTSKPNTITVKDKDGKSWTFVITSSTKFNGDTENESSTKGASLGGATTGATTGDEHTGGTSTGDHTGGTSTGDHTGGTSTGEREGGSSTGSQSTHAAPTLADVCASANINTRDVQVQATPDGSNLDATKVTLQGPHSADSEGTPEAKSTESTSGTPEANGTPEASGTPGH